MIYSILLFFLSCTTPSQEETAHQKEVAPTDWHSDLYPENWTPDHTSSTGLFLHDFSYAGYRNGEETIPIISSQEHYSVLEYGADPETQEDSTNAFQHAIDAASTDGGVVWIPEGVYKIDGLLKITHSNVIIAGEGPEKSRLWFTKDTSMTDRSSILFQGMVQQGEEKLLSQDADTRAQSITVENTEMLNVGQDVSLGWIITEDFVTEHGMSSYWNVFNEQWVPFFRRTIVAIEGNIVFLDVPTRYPAKKRDHASLRVESGYLSTCGIQDIAISNAIEDSHAHTFDRAHAIQLESTKDCWIENVSSFAAPEQEFHLQSGGIKILSSKRVTVSNSQMKAAQNRGGGGNGYLFEISQSSEILIRDSIGIAGRHNFIQNWGFGTTGCVFLRTLSQNGESHMDDGGNLSSVGFSEFHHSLAMANLIDSSVADDGWKAVNRLFYSSGSGHSATENVFWNIRGTGSLYSYQYGQGYVIGSSDIDVYTEVSDVYESHGTTPEDYSEGIGEGDTLTPQSLYEDQLQKRLSQ